MQYGSQEGPKVPFTSLEFILDIDLHYGGVGMANGSPTFTFLMI